MEHAWMCRGKTVRQEGAHGVKTCTHGRTGKRDVRRMLHTVEAELSNTHQERSGVENSCQSTPRHQLHAFASKTTQRDKSTHDAVSRISRFAAGTASDARRGARRPEAALPVWVREAAEADDGTG